MFNKKDYNKKYREDHPEYFRKYYQDNQEKILAYRKSNKVGKAEYDKRYRRNNKAEINLNHKKWRDSNKDKIAKSGERYRKNNREKILKIYYLNNKEKELAYWRKHRDRTLKYKRKYREENKDNILDKARKYNKTENGKATKQRATYKRRIIIKNTINNLTSEEWLNILKEHNFKCVYCGVCFDENNLPTRDHIIPISKGGDNTKNNIVPSCRNCNSKKYNKIIG